MTKEERSEAIKVLNEEKDFQNTLVDKRVFNAICMSIKALKQIDVLDKIVAAIGYEWRTDEPPKEEESYLVTYTHGAMDVCRWTNVWFGGSRSDSHWHWVTAEYCEVAAWMPLPKPYKVESEGKE